MMAGRVDVQRMREHRELFERAVRDNVTLAEARRQAAAERWAETDARLAAKRCGTRIEADHQHDDQDSRRALQWWQRD